MCEECQKQYLNKAAAKVVNAEKISQSGRALRALQMNCTAVALGARKSSTQLKATLI